MSIPEQGSVPKAPRTISPSERLAHRIDEAAELLSIGRSRMYELIASGEIQTYQEGKDQRIARDELTAYVERRREAARALNIAFEAQHKTAKVR